jgi:hypothetical protein
MLFRLDYVICCFVVFAQPYVLLKIDVLLSLTRLRKELGIGW